VGESEIEILFFEPGRPLAQSAKKAAKTQEPTRKRGKKRTLSYLQSIAVWQGQNIKKLLEFTTR
jgi:hypothetical protein